MVYSGSLGDLDHFNNLGDRTTIKNREGKQIWKRRVLKQTIFLDLIKLDFFVYSFIMYKKFYERLRIQVFRIYRGNDSYRRRMGNE